MATIYRGVNSSGAEFGPLPGVVDTDYHYDTLASLQYLYSRGHRHTRVAFKWERVQPTLGAALNSAELTRLQAFVTNAATAGLTVALNVHNFGKYNNIALGAAGGPTQANFVDLWTRLSTAFKNNAAVVAYGLMNEPNGIPLVLSATNRVSTTYTSWVVDDNAPTLAAVTFDGGPTLRMTRATANALMSARSPFFAVTPGEKLTISADIRPETRAGRVKTRIEYWSGSGGTGSVVGSAFSDNSSQTAGTWANRVITSTVPAGAASAKVTAYVDDTTTNGDIGYIRNAYVAVVPPFWHTVSQAAVTAIRANADTKLIFVAGDSWSGVADWATNNGATGWITDSANNFMYEGHHYWDADHSGTYTATYSAEVTASTSGGWSAGAYADSLTNRVMTELLNWRTWLVNNGAQGYVGEYGWPRNIGGHTGDYTQWNTLGATWLNQATSYGMGYAYWSTSEWWGTYELSMYDTTAGVFTTPNSQAPVVELFVPAPVVSASASEGPGVTFRIFNLDTKAYLGDLLDFQQLKAAFEYSAVGSFQATQSLLGRFASLLDTDIEVVAYYNGSEIRNGRWVIRGKSGEATSDDGGSITVAGLSFADVLRKVLLYADTTFNASTPGGIIKALLATASARGAFGATAITTTSFTNTTDSKGVAWANTLTKTYERGVTYRQILESLVANGMIDFEFNGRDLMVYNGTTMGSTIDVTLAAGRHVSETPYKMSTEDRANVVLVEGDNGVTSERTTSGPRREEIYQQQSGITNTATLAVIGDLVLGSAATVTDQRTIKIGPASAIKPLRDFRVGDFVLYDDGLNPVESVRVRQIVLEVNDNGEEWYSCIVGDRLLEGDIKRAIQLGAIAGGVGAGTTGTVNQPPVTDTTTPSAPTPPITVTTATYLEQSGVVSGQATASWAAVTTNTDASTITDLDHYDVQFQSSVPLGQLAANQWSANMPVPAGTTTTYFGPLRPGSSVTVRVRAVDNSGHASAWTQSSATTVVSDTTPPPQPSTPTVVPFFRGIRVTWNGLDASAGAMPGDFERLEIHMSTTSGFTPSSATLVDQLKTRGGTSPLSDLTYGTTYFVKLIAYDTTGNASTPSAQASATPSQLSDPDLPNNLVTGAKIADKTIAVKNLTVGAFTDNMAPNANMESLDSNNRPNFWTNVGSVQGAGSLALMVAETTAPIAGTASMKVSPTTTASVEIVSDALNCTPTEIYYFKVELRTSRVLAGGGIVELAIYSHTAANVTAGTRTSVTTSTGATTSFSLEGSFTAPAGHKFMAMGVWAKTDTGGTYDAFIDDVELRKIVGTANIANASINNAKIANLAVDNAKIADLSAGKITTGTLAADVILGARIRTATSGNRVDISGVGIEMYRGTFRTGWWRPDTGQLRIYNDTDASLTSTGHGLQFGDDSGQNLIIDTNEIMVRNNGGVDNLSLNQYGGSVGMATTAYPGNPYSINAMRVADDKVRITNPVLIYAGVGADANDVDVLNESPPLMIGINSSYHVQFDNNELQAVDVDSPSEFGINRQGGNVNIHKNHQFSDFGSLPWLWWKPKFNNGSDFDVSIIMGNTSSVSGIGSVFIRDFTGANARDLTCRTLTQTSGRDTKTNVVDISDQDMLTRLQDVKVYSYELLSDPAAPINGNKMKGITPSGKMQIGPMAEELALLNIPGLVEELPHTGPGVNVASFLGLLLLAGKQLRRGLVQARGEIVDLKARVAALEAKVGP